jgi:hypothetical protein
VKNAFQPNGTRYVNFAEKIGMKIVTTYAETTRRSTFTLQDRPSLQLATDRALRAGGALVISNFFVLGPGMQILEEVTKKGVLLLVMDAGPNHLGVQIRANAAAGVRTWRGHENRPSRNRLNGAKPMGNRVNLPEARAKAIAATRAAADSFALRTFPNIQEILASGATSYRKVADVLNERQVQTARGSAWYATTVRSVVVRATDLLSRQAAAGAPDIHVTR